MTEAPQAGSPTGSGTSLRARGRASAGRPDPPPPAGPRRCNWPLTMAQWSLTVVLEAASDSDSELAGPQAAAIMASPSESFIAINAIKYVQNLHTLFTIFTYFMYIMYAILFVIMLRRVL